MRNANPAMLIILLTLMTASCASNDDRLIEMAREHAARQAESQRQATELQHQVAEGSRQLVESDAKARKDLTALQQQLRSDQAEIGQQRDQLENDRREIAAQRYRDPIIAAIITDIGIVLACLLPLAVCIYVLWSVTRPGESDRDVAELLVQEFVAPEPRFLLPGRSSFSAIEGQGVVDSHPDSGRNATDRLTD